LERLFAQHVAELDAMGLLSPRAKEIARLMDEAADKLYASEIEHYLAREVNPDHRRILGQYGLLGIQVPERYGGLGGDAMALTLAFERLGQLGMGPVTFLDVQCCLTEGIIIRWGTEDQKQRYLRPAAKGELFMSFCLTEPQAGSDPASLETQYEVVNGGFRIRGSKYLITNGSFADAFIVFARKRGENIISAILVDRQPAVKLSLQLKEKVGLFTSDTTLLEFEDAFAPRENLIGEEGQGLPIAYTGLLSGRIGIAAGCIGTIEDCLNSSVERAKSRVQHGKPIAKHQLVQRHIVAIAEQLEMARWPVYTASWWKKLHDENPSDVELRRAADFRATLAKKIATNAAWRAADHAVQVFGGFGYSILSAPGRHYIDLRAPRIYEGADEVMELKIASYVLGKEYEAYR